MTQEPDITSVGVQPRVLVREQTLDLHLKYCIKGPFNEFLD